MQKTFAVLAISLVTFQTNAQPAGRDVVTNTIEWFATTANLKVSNRLTVVLDGQVRFAGNHPLQHQARTMLDIKINDHWSIAPLCYVYTWNYRYGEQPNAFRNNEHRTFQQVTYKHDLAKFKVDHRVRFEQRFIQVHSLNGDDLVDEGYTNEQMRLRYRFQARLPLGKETIDPKTWFIGAFDEVFYSWGKTVTFDEPDQNRIYLGLGYQVDKRLNLQAGGLYQMLIKSNGAKQENNIGLLVTATYNVSLMKGQ